MAHGNNSWYSSSSSGSADLAILCVYEKHLLPFSGADSLNLFIQIHFYLSLPLSHRIESIVVLICVMHVLYE